MVAGWLVVGVPGCRGASSGGRGGGGTVGARIWGLGVSGRGGGGVLGDPYHIGGGGGGLATEHATIYIYIYIYACACARAPASPLATLAASHQCFRVRVLALIVPARSIEQHCAGWWFLGFMNEFGGLTLEIVFGLRMGH